jgi:hypothetical protein
VTSKLPPKGFVLADVLGKTKLEVDQVLGHGEPLDADLVPWDGKTELDLAPKSDAQLEGGPLSYDLEYVPVVVAFEAGRAVFVAVVVPGFHDADVERAAVLAWMHAPRDMDIDRTRSDVSLGVWVPGAQDRQVARLDLAKTVTESLRSSGVGTAVANFTRLEISAPAGSCTQETLEELAHEYPLRRAHFETLKCMTMESGGPVLHLR